MHKVKNDRRTKITKSGTHHDLQAPRYGSYTGSERSAVKVAWLEIVQAPNQVHTISAYFQYSLDSSGICC